MQSFSKPERKDRVGDSHGVVLIYVKESVYHKRRADLEPQGIGIEYIWIALVLKHKHVLFGLFHRPPNSDSVYYSTSEDSIHRAVDTGVSDIIVTGDSNLYMLNPQTARKISSSCDQFSLHQMIKDPTHFTENSSSLIDLVLVSNEDHVIHCGVGDPFLQQELRYHCPVFGVFSFSKPKRKSFKRHIWRYEQGDYNLLRQRAATTDWTAFNNPNINVYAKNIINELVSIPEYLGSASEKITYDATSTSRFKIIKRHETE